MSTTTKNPKLTERQAAAREALAAARALANSRAEAIEVAEVEVSRALARLAGGDDSVTSLDLAQARAEVERSTLLHTAATRAIRDAQTEVAAADGEADPSAAQVVANLLTRYNTQGRGFPQEPEALHYEDTGQQITTGLHRIPFTLGTPSADSAPQGDDLAHVWLWQVAPTEYNYDAGTFSGTVLVGVLPAEGVNVVVDGVRGALQFLAERFGEEVGGSSRFHLEKAGMPSTSGPITVDGRRVQVTAIRVSAAVEDIPRLADPSDIGRPIDPSWQFAAWLGDQVAVALYPGVVDYGGQTKHSGHVSVDESRCVAGPPDAQGVRTSAFTAKIRFVSNDRRVDSNDAVKMIAPWLPTLAGQWVWGLGRIVTAELTHGDHGHIDMASDGRPIARGVVVTVKATLTSRVSQDGAQ